MTYRGRLLGWTILVAALTALNYGARASGGKPDRDVLYHYSAAVGGVVQYGILLGIVLALAHGPGMRERLALRRPSSWGRTAAYVVGAIISVYATLAVVSSFLNPGREQGLTPSHWEPRHAGAYAANFVVIAGIAPVVEELTFRGLGFHLLRRYGEWFAVGAVGLAFGLVHGLVEGLPVLVLFGAVLALVRSRTGSVYPGIAVHVLFNTVSLIAAVTT
jgi:membrane protease YdiL (CAAX protease family)